MTCLDATFTLTPKTPFFTDGLRGALAALFCWGADFGSVSPWDFPSAETANQFYFDGAFASDPNLDYSQWANRTKARLLASYIDLGTYGSAQKELALVFGFEARDVGADGRLLIFSDAGLLHDQRLVYGDTQFLLGIETVDQPLWLYFVHVGGSFAFKGLSGYVV